SSAGARSRSAARSPGPTSSTRPTSTYIASTPPGPVCQGWEAHNQLRGGWVFPPTWTTGNAATAVLRAASACGRAAHPWPTAAPLRYRLRSIQLGSFPGDHDPWQSAQVESGDGAAD